jgi:hypothetical protein
MLCKVQYSTKSPHLQGLFWMIVHPFSLNCTNEMVLSVCVCRFFAPLGRKNDTQKMINPEQRKPS